MPKAQMISNPSCVSKLIIGPKNAQIVFTRSLALSTRSLLWRNRSISRCSCANALTTRMPGIASASTLVISAHARLPRSNPLRRRIEPYRPARRSPQRDQGGDGQLPVGRHQDPRSAGCRKRSRAVDRQKVADPAPAICRSSTSGRRRLPPKNERRRDGVVRGCGGLRDPLADPSQDIVPSEQPGKAEPAA